MEDFVKKSGIISLYQDFGEEILVDIISACKNFNEEEDQLAKEYLSLQRERRIFRRVLGKFHGLE